MKKLVCAQCGERHKLFRRAFGYTIKYHAIGIKRWFCSFACFIEFFQFVVP